MELIKTQMQVHSDTNGPVDVIKKIYNTAGFKGLATGLGITVAREVPACGLYFSSYELMVRYVEIFYIENIMIKHLYSIYLYRITHIYNIL